MSQNIATIKYRKYETQQEQQPNRLKKIDLKVNKQPRKILLPAISIISLGLFMLVLLLQITLHAYMAQTSFTMHNKEIELTKLREETQMLQIEIDKLNSPKNIDQGAKQQSMIPSEQIGYINLKDSTITGTNN